MTSHGGGTTNPWGDFFFSAWSTKPPNLPPPYLFFQQHIPPRFGVMRDKAPPPTILSLNFTTNRLQ